MVRVFLWRAYFEVLNLLKLLGVRGGTRRYFAFGGNLDPAVLRGRRISVRGAAPHCLRDYRLVFDQAGPFVGGGYASIQPAPGYTVFGMLYELAAIDEWRLDCYEAVPFVRKYRKVRLRGAMGEFYFYQTRSPKPGLPPTATYLAKLLARYELATPEGRAFLDELRATPTLEQEVPAKHIHFLVKDYDVAGARLRRLVEWYDHLSFSFFLRLILRPSIFGSAVPV